MFHSLLFVNYANRALLVLIVKIDKWALKWKLHDWKLAKVQFVMKGKHIVEKYFWS